MNRARLWSGGLALTVLLGASWNALAGAAPGSCESEASAVPAASTRHFLALGASKGVFYNRTGPSFVMLMKMDAARGESEMGAVGIYADQDGQAVFGAVPWQTYDAFLHEPARGKSQNVILRLEINESQYVRILRVLRTWARRAREHALLYPDEIFMNNIVLVKQATEELNRCAQTVRLYQLDWGVNDRISEDRAPARVPFLVFEELRRLNEPLHVPDSRMPAALLSLTGSKPLPALEPASVDEPVTGPAAPAHMHHMHEHAGTAQ